MRSDAFASVRIGNHEYFTRVIASETDPVFNERFSFLTAVSAAPAVCSVTFYDRERCVRGALAQSTVRLIHFLSHS